MQKAAPTMLHTIATVRVVLLTPLDCSPTRLEPGGVVPDTRVPVTVPSACVMAVVEVARLLASDGGDRLAVASGRDVVAREEDAVIIVVVSELVIVAACVDTTAPGPAKGKFIVIKPAHQPTHQKNNAIPNTSSKHGIGRDDTQGDDVGRAVFSLLVTPRQEENITLAVESAPNSEQHANN